MTWGANIVCECSHPIPYTPLTLLQPVCDWDLFWTFLSKEWGRLDMVMENLKE